MGTKGVGHWGPLPPAPNFFWPGGTINLHSHSTSWCNLWNMRNYLKTLWPLVSKHGWLVRAGKFHARSALSLVAVFLCRTGGEYGGPHPQLGGTGSTINLHTQFVEHKKLFWPLVAKKWRWLVRAGIFHMFGHGVPSILWRPVFLHQSCIQTYVCQNLHSIAISFHLGQASQCSKVHAFEGWGLEAKRLELHYSHFLTLSQPPIELSLTGFPCDPLSPGRPSAPGSPGGPNMPCRGKQQ